MFRNFTTHAIKMTYQKTNIALRAHPSFHRARTCGKNTIIDFERFSRKTKNNQPLQLEIDSVNSTYVTMIELS